eukprot:122440-Pyramimonas_sp.AAC.1
MAKENGKEENVAPSYVWLDVDCGIDDAQGVMLCLRAHHSANLLGISCVYGNVAVEQVGRNVGRILHVCERPDVPYYLGASRNILTQGRVITDFHGQDGLGDAGDFEHGPHCPEPREGSAVTRMIEAVNAHPKQVALIATGPLTNIALACLLDTDFASKVGSFTVMGGAVKGEGNTTPSGEYNFVADPEAAHICLKLFDRTLLLSWELMVRHQIDWEVVERWTRKGNPRSRFLRSILENLMVAEKLARLIEQLMAATMIEGCDMTGQLTRGQSIVDWYDTPDAVSFGYRTADLVHSTHPLSVFRA